MRVYATVHKHHSVKCEGCGGKSALDEDEWSASCSGHFTLGVHCIVRFSESPKEFVLISLAPICINFIYILCTRTIEHPGQIIAYYCFLRTYSSYDNITFQ
jgi:hypothetical protein